MVTLKQIAWKTCGRCKKRCFVVFFLFFFFYRNLTLIHLIYLAFFSFCLITRRHFSFSLCVHPVARALSRSLWVNTGDSPSFLTSQRDESPTLNPERGIPKVFRWPEGATEPLCPTDKVMSTPVNSGNSQFPLQELVLAKTVYLTASENVWGLYYCYYLGNIWISVYWLRLRNAAWPSHEYRCMCNIHVGVLEFQTVWSLVQFLSYLADSAYELTLVQHYVHFRQITEQEFKCERICSLFFSCCLVE